jgi:hypothetical protein
MTKDKKPNQKKEKKLVEEDVRTVRKNKPNVLANSSWMSITSK